MRWTVWRKLWLSSTSQTLIGRSRVVLALIRSRTRDSAPGAEPARSMAEGRVIAEMGASLCRLLRWPPLRPGDRPLCRESVVILTYVCRLASHAFTGWAPLRRRLFPSRQRFEYRPLLPFRRRAGAGFSTRFRPAP